MRGIALAENKPVTADLLFDAGFQVGAQTRQPGAVTNQYQWAAGIAFEAEVLMRMYSQFYLRIQFCLCAQPAGCDAHGAIFMTFLSHQQMDATVAWN